MSQTRQIGRITHMSNMDIKSSCRFVCLRVGDEEDLETIGQFKTTIYPLVFLRLSNVIETGLNCSHGGQPDTLSY